MGGSICFFSPNYYKGTGGYKMAYSIREKKIYIYGHRDSMNIDVKSCVCKSVNNG